MLGVKCKYNEEKKGRKEMKRNYEEMTVTELRAETRQRGLPQQKNGKKFTKIELIDRLKQDDMKFGVSEEENKIKKEKKEWKKPEIVITKEEEKQEVTIEQVTSEITKLQDKLSGTARKEDVQIGSFVVFVKYTERKGRSVIKRLLTGKITEIDRKNEIVKVETPVGTCFTMSYASLLFCKRPGDRKGFPDEIVEAFDIQKKERENYKKRIAYTSDKQYVNRGV